MLCSIFVAIIFNTLFPTNCYVINQDIPSWHHLNRVRKNIPQEADELPPNAPYNRYEVHPGSHGMFSDIAQEIYSRMRGIAKGPFIVVFDFGGIAAKYFSIIEDVTSESGDRQASVSTVAEPLSIVKHDGVTPTQVTKCKASVTKPAGAMRAMTATAGIATSTVLGSPGSILDNDSSEEGGDDSTNEEIMANPTSPAIDITSPRDTAAMTDSINAMGNMASTATSSSVIIEGGIPLPPDPILPPQDWSSGKDPSAIGLSDSLLTDIVHGVKNGLDGGKAVEFPGNTPIALLYPDHQISSADKSTNEIMYFTTLPNAALTATDAQALYTSLKPATTQIAMVIKNRGFNCVTLNSTKLDLKIYVIDNIVFGEGNICGLENMQPGNNVTITKDDENIMEVTVPLILKDLTVKIKSVDVNNYFFAVIKGQPIEAGVKEISCKGTFSFRKGKVFELTSIHIEWGDITGIHIKLEGAMEEGGAASGIIDNLAGALSGVIKSFISPILDEIEKQITKNILGP